MSVDGVASVGMGWVGWWGLEKARGRRRGEKDGGGGMRLRLVLCVRALGRVGGWIG